MIGWWRRLSRRADARRKLIIVASTLPSKSGHELNELRGYRQAAPELGLELKILLPRDTRRDLVELVGGEPVIDPVPPDTVFQPCMSIPQLITFAHNAHAQAALWSTIAKEEPTSVDLLYFVHTRAHLMAAVGRWLAGRAATQRPAVFFRVMGMEFNDFDTQRFGRAAIFYRLAGEQLRDCLGEERLFLLAETRFAVPAINRVCLRRAFIMPMPKDLKHPPGGFGAGPPRPVVVYANLSRQMPEMFQAFADVVRKVHTHHSQVRFLVKCTGAARPNLVNDFPTVVELLPDEQDPIEYFENFRRSSVVLLAYDPATYRIFRTSGVFIEAASFGRPVVVSAGTWMADCVRRGIGVGTIFEEPTADSIADALLRLLADADAMSVAAQAGAAAVRAENTCYRYLQRMIELAGSSFDMKAVYEPGDEVDFSDPLGSRQFLGEGWEETESWGVWSNGPQARLCFRLESPPRSPLMLRVFAHAFVNPSHPQLRVGVGMGDRFLANWIFDHDDPGTRWCEAAIPQTADRVLAISLTIEAPMSPAALGESEDTRQLGLALHKLVIVDTPAESNFDMEAVYDPGDEVDFSDPLGSRQFLGEGWDETESWGVWSNGPEAKLCFLLEAPPRAPLTLRVFAHAFVRVSRPLLRVGVWMGDRLLENWSFDHDNPDARWCEAAIPQTADRVLAISLTIDAPTSPAALGESEDARQLGLALHKLVIVETPRTYGPRRLRRRPHEPKKLIPR